MTEQVGPARSKPSLPGEGRWIARPRKSRWLLKLGAWGAFLVQVSGLLRRALEFLLGKPAGEFAFNVVLGILFAVALYFSLREWLARRLRAEDLAQIDGGFGDQFPTELTIVVNGKPLGMDRGVVWFAEGLMGFSGKAASYVLAASDLAPVMIRPKRDKLKREMPKGTILLRGAPKDASIVVTPLSGHAKTYRERLKRFIDDAEVTAAERFWPPLQPFDEQRDALPDGIREGATRA